jgi:hypothetical protein
VSESVSTGVKTGVVSLLVCTIGGAAAVITAFL